MELSQNVKKEICMLISYKKAFDGILSMFLLCMAVTALGSGIAGSKPNIVYLMTDDQSINGLGCYGNKEIITPHIDKMASQGVRFLNHYNTTAICMASRANVMTGLYEYRSGVNFDHGPMQREFMEQSYPVLLRKAGYYTGFAGKIGFQVMQGKKRANPAEYFDKYAGPNGSIFATADAFPEMYKYADKHPHITRAFTAWADDFIVEAKKSGKPFCMSISFVAPHGPTIPDPQDYALYKDKEFTPPATYGKEFGKHLSTQANSSRAAKSFHYWSDFTKSARKYYATLTGVDVAVGLIRETLEREGLADNTVIIYTSDNGYNCGAHGFAGKVLPYEEASKAPLIVYDPRLPNEKRGVISDALTANVDMMTTMCDLAGVTPAVRVDGKSIVPLLENPKSEIHKHVPLFNLFGPRSAQSIAVVTKEWKYIYWYYGGRGMTPTEELFHLSKDPIEMKNVVDNPEYAEALNRMRDMQDSERVAIAEDMVPGRKYESYPLLCDRSVAWSEKAETAAKIQSAWELTGNFPEYEELHRQKQLQKRNKKKKQKRPAS
jgi:arylsulfatase A-like enzyme